MSIPKEDRPYFRAHRVQSDEKPAPRPTFVPHQVAPLRPYSALNPASPGCGGSQKFVPPMIPGDAAKFAPKPAAKFEPQMIETVLPADFVPKTRSRPRGHTVLQIPQPPVDAEADQIEYLLDFLVN
jgi:hypothetical protein